MISPTLTFDGEANALYVRFSDKPVTGTIELSLSVYVDVDAEGNPVGFEILNADSGLLSSLSERSHPTALRDLLKIEAA